MPIAGTTKDPTETKPVAKEAPASAALLQSFPDPKLSVAVGLALADIESEAVATTPGAPREAGASRPEDAMMRALPLADSTNCLRTPLKNARTMHF